MYVSGGYILIGIDISVTPAVQQSIDVSRLPGPQQGLKKLWNFEARACIGQQKNLDFINKNVRLD